MIRKTGIYLFIGFLSAWLFKKRKDKIDDDNYNNIGFC